jgi:hypothetical protein
MAQPPTQRVVSFDPSVQGLDAAVGDIAQRSGGGSAWVKSGPGLTDWTSFPTTGGGFGSDTTVQLPNSGSTLVNALRLLLSLTANTPAAEASKWLVKVLGGGAAIDALSLESNQVGLPDLIYYLADTDTGWFRSAANTLCAFVGGAQAIFFSAAGIILNASIGAQLGWSGVSAGVAYTSGTGSIKVTPAAAAGNTDLGLVAGALATGATHGFATISTSAGAPTGVPTLTAGQSAIHIDTSTPKLWVNYGSGWKGVAVA